MFPAIFVCPLLCPSYKIFCPNTGMLGVCLKSEWFEDFPCVSGSSHFSFQGGHGGFCLRNAVTPFFVQRLNMWRLLKHSPSDSLLHLQRCLSLRLMQSHAHCSVHIQYIKKKSHFQGLFTEFTVAICCRVPTFQYSKFLGPRFQCVQLWGISHVSSTGPYCFAVVDANMFKAQLWFNVSVRSEMG